MIGRVAPLAEGPAQLRLGGAVHAEPVFLQNGGADRSLLARQFKTLSTLQLIFGRLNNSGAMLANA